MSLFPAARVTLDDKLSDTERDEALRQIKAVKGVLSSTFNKTANSVAITYLGADVQKNVEKIDGVKGFAAWRGF